MLLDIAAFELRYILRSPLSWFIALAFFAGGTIAFGFVAGEAASDIFALGRNVWFNAPFYIAIELLLISLAAFFVAPAFVGEALIKDREYDFDCIVFSTPVSKFSYLYGRFLGGFGALLVTFLCAPLGMMLSPLWAFPVPEGSLGSFNILNYLIVVLVYALPSLLLFSSMVFVVAVVARKTIYTYLLNLAVAIFVLVGTATIARLRLLSPETLTASDPTLLRLMINLPSYWNPEQLNTTLISLDALQGPAILINRLLTTVAALLFLGLSYVLFSFTRHAAKTPRTSKQTGKSDNSNSPPVMPVALARTPMWSTGVTFRQFLLRTRFEVRTVFWSFPFLLIMLINLVQTLNTLSVAAEADFLSSYEIANRLGGGAVGIVILLIILVFTPEIFFREHKNRLHEIIHALPTPSWVFVASKLLALIGILIAIVIMNICVTLFFLRENVDIDLQVYLKRCFYVLLPALCFAVLVSFLQVLANNRFVGAALIAIYLLVTFTLYFLGFQHPLYQNVFVAEIPVPLSAMNAGQDFQAKGNWLRAYWVGISGLLLLLTYVLFARGVLQPLKYRLKFLQKFRTAAYYVPACAFLLAVVGTGSFIYYNTNILNRYYTQKGLEALFAQYEILYRQYENLPMPTITDIEMDLALFPEGRRLEFEAELTVVNKSGQALDTVHLELPREIEFEEITVQDATLSSLDTTHRYAIYKLATPMAPGEQRIVSMTAYKQLRGFRAADEDITLVENGTYFEINTLIPHIGFSQTRLLLDPQTREEYGLDPTFPLGKLIENRATSRYFNTAAMRADSEFVNFAATLSTEPGQTAVTAGRLTEQWQADGRNYFRYVTDTPILPVIPFFSARYAVLRDTWRNPDASAASDIGNVDIEIYYHPEHTYHLDLMMQALKDGLAAFGSAYGPYQYQQLRVMEYPGYRRNSRSLPTTIAHSEANGFVQRDPAENYESMAHELSHHWWGHQFIGARVEGTGVLAEGMASYSARMLMEKKYGKEFQLHRSFVSANRRYLRGRNTDRFGETPLYQSQAQSYLDYYKGESVMYALQNHLGEDLVNTAMREFFATYKNNTRPYVAITDFLEILKHTAGPQHLGLIEDFFEKITLYEFLVDDARAEALDDGRYRVTLDITTAKFYGDDKGRETAAEFNSPVNIGLFAKHPLNRSFRIEEDVIYFELASPGDGKSTVEFIVDRLPLFAGIDPYDVLIERDTTNNIRQVTISEPTDSGRPLGP